MGDVWSLFRRRIPAPFNDFNGLALIRIRLPRPFIPFPGAEHPGADGCQTAAAVLKAG